MSMIQSDLLLGQEGGAGYSIARSLRFNSSDSAYCSRVPASAGNRKTWTWAGWVKRSALQSGTSNTYMQIFSAGTGATARDVFFFDTDTDDTLAFYSANGIAGAGTLMFRTNAVFRDASAWYHIVLAVDTTQATAANRVKLYVNGVEQSFSTASYPSQNAEGYINLNNAHYIATHPPLTEYFSGYLADIHFIDGQALTPSSFGQFDANGIWQPKAYTGTYGTNGFKLNFSDNSTAAALGTDTSGAGNNWTVNNLSVADVYKNAVAFDGSGDSLTAPSGASITGTGDFTIEMWMLPRSFGSGYQVQYANDTSGGVSFGINSNGTIFFGKSLLSIDGTSSNSVTFGAWNHIALTRTSGTFRLFINGSQGFSGTPSINYVSGVVRLGADGGGGALFFNGLLASVRTIQGTSLYSSNFTPPSAPLSALTGTTLLTCQSSSIVDQSANSFTVTAVGDAHVVKSYVGAAVDGSDSTVDSPVNGSQVDTGVGGEVRGNYCTLNPLDKGSAVTLANGNLDLSVSGTHNLVAGTIMVSSGKYYAEYVATSLNSGAGLVGVCNPLASRSSYLGGTNGGVGFGFSGDKWVDGSVTGGVSGGATTGDVIGIALDKDNNQVSFYKNNTLQFTQTGLNSSQPYTFAYGHLNSGGYFNFGQRQWAYQAPAGFKALCTANLPTPTGVVAQPSTAMDVKLYTGNGSTQNITGLGFSPDLVWVKMRSKAYWHELVDSVRGANKSLFSNATDAEATINTVTAFNSDGFAVGVNGGANGGTNESAGSYAAWCWDAGSSTVTNTQGSITSSVRANASAGFSIVTYTGTGATTTRTIGHGLNVSLGMVIVKARDSGSNDMGWGVSHTSVAAPNYLYLNSTDAAGNGGPGQGQPSVGSGSTFSILAGTVPGTNNFNASGIRYVAYCFAPVAGFSAFGSYIGNGSSDGPFVWTGMRPRWILVKNATTGGTAYDWFVWDTARSSFNTARETLFANLSSAEAPTYITGIDVLSNGFKLRDASAAWNGNGQTIIYAAFSEACFQFARAR